jgi:predicted DsbA family dithiol-disulfide isomerase
MPQLVLAPSGNAQPHGAFQIDIVSDTICPWCFVGKRRLEKALTELPPLELGVRWRPFQLDATIPEEGMDRQTYLARKFGSEEAKRVYDRIRAVGEEEGIAFAFEKIKKTPNTINSHRLLHWAGEEGIQDAVAERLFQLYFLEGEDIGDLGVLARAAAECGMDEGSVRARLSTDESRSLVLREIAQANGSGVDGVPCFIFDGSTFLPGAQPADVLAETISRMLMAA